MDEKGISIVTEVNARKEVLKANDMSELLKEIDLLYVASGKKVVEFKSDLTEKGEIVTKVCGRSGNLRAPTLRIGRILFVGYNTALYEKVCNS